MQNNRSKRLAQLLPSSWVEQGPFLVAEITKALKATGGAASWAFLTTFVFGSGDDEILSKNKFSQKSAVTFELIVQINSPTPKA
jgi:hypothetical protein